MALTRRQKEVLDFIIDFVEQNGYNPSYEELAHGLNLASVATIHKHIEALQARNYLRRNPNQSRSLDVSPKYLQERRRSQQTQPKGVPLAGRIAAGRPIETMETPEALQFSDFTGKGETFALQVTGESMIDDHICDGDYVLVERSSHADPGNIVVALVDGTETTLKRFYPETGGKIRLQPANTAMEPIILEPSRVQVQGRVLAVLRKYR